MENQGSSRSKLNRRRFLGLVAGGASALVTGGLVGCGGGGGGGDFGTIPLGVISEDDREACLDAIQAFLDTIDNLPFDEQATQALAFVRTRPEFIDSDINEDGVWAIFIDAVPFMLFLNREPDPDPINIGHPLQPYAATEVPVNTIARLINTLGPAFTDITPVYEPILSNNGYAAVIDPGTVESLRAFNTDGVFIIVGAHSGMAGVPLLTPDRQFRRQSNGRPVTSPMFGVWTATEASSATAAPYIDDIANFRLGIGMAHHGNGQPGNKAKARHYWFTSKFVDHYMNFGQDSLVWFNSCQSHNALSVAFRQACIRAGAGLYVGWNRRTNKSDCIACGTFILDRLIGSNSTNPHELPPQRPFDYVQVWQDMARQGLPSGLVYTAGGNFGLLAPSIAYVLINEFDDEAHLFGTFGNPLPSERQVTIAATPVTIKSWTKDKIIVNLPRTGAGSSGDVEVRVRNHKSNLRQITQWRFDIAYDWLHTQLLPLSTAGLFTLLFRADIGHYRDHPGVPPLEPVRWAVAKRTSMGTLTGAGTATDNSGCTNTWSGIAQFEAGGFGGTPDFSVISRMKIDTDTQTGALGLSLGALAPPPFNWHVACPGSPPGDAKFMVSIGLLEGWQGFLTPDPNNTTPIQLPFFNLPFAADYTVPAHHFIDNTFSPLRIDIAWPEVIPTAPPDPDAAVRPPLLTGSKR